MTFDISPKNQKIIYINKAGKNIEGFFVFFFLLSYLVCSQIWLNHLMDDHHFSYIYITKLTQKKKKPESSTCRQLEHFIIYVNEGRAAVQTIYDFNPISKHICSHHRACTSKDMVDP
jgi:hypothetical protein